VEVSGDLLSQAMLETCAARGLPQGGTFGPYEFVGPSVSTSFVDLIDTRIQ
jgi:hypothetical protein